MVRPLSVRWLIPFALVVLLVPACSDSTDEAADTTHAPTTTIVDTTAATLLVDEWIKGWNSDDPDATVSVFADEFYI
jgi:hypothetical protein